MAGCSYTPAQFASIVSEAGAPTNTRTAQRYFARWREQHVEHVIERASDVGGGRAGKALHLSDDGLAAFLRGELPVP